MDSFGFEFGHVVSEVDQTDGRAVGGGQTEEFEDAFVLRVGHVDVDEQDAAFVVLRRGAEFTRQLLEIGGRLSRKGGGGIGKGGRVNSTL